MKLIANLSLALFFSLFSFNAYSSSISKNNSYEYGTMQRIRIDFESPNGYVRPLLLGFTTDNTATDGVDYGYDGANFDQFPDDLFWLIENEKYVIQGVGEFDNTKQYPLALFLENSGTIAISLNSLENFDTDINVYVYDSLLETYTTINNAEFNMDITSGEYLNRFYIAFMDLSITEDNESAILSTNESVMENPIIQYYGSTKTLQIDIADQSLSSNNKINIFNISGQHVYEYVMKPNTNKLKLPLNNNTEKYLIVEVVSENYSKRKLLAIH